MKDSIVKSVVNKFKNRSKTGIDKYGVTLDRKDLSYLQWLLHLQEELQDATLYIEKIIQLEKQKENFKYKWTKLFAAKRYNTEDGVITLTPEEQQELLDESV